MRLLALVLILAALAASIASASAEEAFVTNQLSDDLMVVDLASARAVATIPIGGKPAGVAVSADGRFAYVTSPDAKAVTVVDAATRQVAGRIEVGGGPLGIAVTPDGKGATLEWAGAFYRGFPNNDPPPELSDEAAVKAVKGLYQAGLEALKKKIESGS